jgi:hypothetical protein
MVVLGLIMIIKIAYCGAVLGATILLTAVLLFAAIVRATTSTILSVFASSLFLAVAVETAATQAKPAFAG